MSVLKRRIPAVFEPLLAPARYKGAYGGRGSGKSHFFGEQLIEDCLCEPGMLAVCIREVQNTLAQSSKRLIEDKIKAFGVESRFRILRDKIETPGGGLIIFMGMQDRAVNNSARQNMADTRAAFNDLAWFQYGLGDMALVPAYNSGTSFTLAGEDTNAYWHAGRRVRAVGSTTGTIFGTIASASYNSGSNVTTITVAWDSGALNNEALTIAASIIPVTGLPLSIYSMAGYNFLFRNLVEGLTLSNDSGSPNTKIDVAAGVCADASNAVLMDLPSGTTINCSTTGANGLDTGSLAESTWYHSFVIGGAGGLATAALASLSTSSPALPNGYSYARRIGSFKTDASGHVLPFVQLGDEFWWSTCVTDFSAVTISGAPTLKTMSVPSGVNVTWQGRLVFLSTAANDDFYAWSPQNGNGATSPPFPTIYSPAAGQAASDGSPLMTNAAAQIYMLVDAVGTATVYAYTSGWIDRRGKS